MNYIPKFFLFFFNVSFVLTGNSQNSHQLINKTVATVIDISSISTQNLKNGYIIYAKGFRKKYDGGEGIFRWKNSSLEQEFDGMIIKSLGGYWVREIGHQINIKMFGVWANGVDDDTKKINLAFDYLAYINSGTIYFPQGVYKVSETINIHSSNIKIIFSPNAILKNYRTDNPNFRSDYGLIYNMFKIAPNNPLKSENNINPLKPLAEITSNYFEGDKKIIVNDASQISVKDIIQIKSTEPFYPSRSSYIKEYKVEVVGKIKNTIFIKPIPQSFNLLSDTIFPDQIWESQPFAQNIPFWKSKLYEIIQSAKGEDNFENFGSKNNNLGTTFYSTKDVQPGVIKSGLVRIISKINVYKPLFLENIIIKGGQFDIGFTRKNKDSNFLTQHFGIYNVKGFSMESCKLINGTYMGVYLEDCINNSIKKISIICNEIMNQKNGFYGIYLFQCQNSDVKDSYFKTHFCAIDAALSYNVMIERNVCNYSTISPHIGKNIIIQKNTINNSYIGARCQNMKILENVITNNPANTYGIAGIDISENGQVGKLEIKKNKIQWIKPKDFFLGIKDIKYGIYCQSSNSTPSKYNRRFFKNITISNNEFYNCDGLIFASDLEYGINSSNIQIKSNLIYGVKEYGILIQNVVNCIIDGNTIKLADEFKNNKYTLINHNEVNYSDFLSMSHHNKIVGIFAVLNGDKSKVWWHAPLKSNNHQMNWLRLNKLPEGIVVNNDGNQKSQNIFIKKNNIEKITEEKYLIGNYQK